MKVNTFDRILSYSYRVDADRIKQNLQQAEKNNIANQQSGDRATISEEGRNALKEKMTAMERFGQTGEIKKLSSVGAYSVSNDFERIMSELGSSSVSDDFVSKDYCQEKVDGLKARFEKEEGTKINSFDCYVNKMASAYNLMRNSIEEKYAVSDRQKEYYVAEDGSTQELTKEKELEMLDHAYETHSRFMATSTQIWSELKDFKVQTVYHSSGAKTETSSTKEQNIGIKEQAYNALMSAISTENSRLLEQKTGSLNHFHLNLDISSSERDVLNSIWDYYANIKRDYQ